MIQELNDSDILFSTFSVSECVSKKALHHVLGSLLLRYSYAGLLALSIAFIALSWATGCVAVEMAQKRFFSWFVLNLKYMIYIVGQIDDLYGRN